MIPTNLKITTSEMEDGDFIEFYRYVRKLYISRQVMLALHFKKMFKVGDTVKVLPGDNQSSYEGMIGVISRLNPKMALIILARKRNPEYEDVFSGRTMIKLRCSYILLKNLEDEE